MFKSVYLSIGLSSELRAMRSIPIGEPLTVSVVSLTKMRSDIRDELKMRSIDCQCVKCDQTIESIGYQKMKTSVVNRYKERNHYLQGFYIRDPSGVVIREHTKLVEQMLAIVEEAYGTYSPKKTHILYWLLRLMYDNDFRDGRKRYMNLFKANLKVTHGQNHVLRDIVCYESHRNPYNQRNYDLDQCLTQ